ncbi:MAG TPA: GTPase HflX [Polyangiaceae bacterium]|nr:GTPase HflX [Polyangiaceae bacterium]
MKRPQAVLVGVRLPGVSEPEQRASLAELERLVRTLGYEVKARVTQLREQIEPKAVLGEGKLKELKELLGVVEDDDETQTSTADDAEPEDEIELVAVDHDISPSQLRNLERIILTDVLDRTGVIIEIFHRHAKSREAKLQVEIARLNYAAPRVRESSRGKERQAGRGAGEAALELDRRRIRDRLAELKRELVQVQQTHDVRRAQRQGTRRVALVGYTNAGKSSLMRALTGSEVLVQDKLFATLDTTVRALQPEVRPRILISDTVGFIKKLPHDLVASFKSTLDEALEASLILHVVDASDDERLSQLELTREVLGEIGAGEVPTQLVFNKLDKTPEEVSAALRAQFPDAWYLSAKSESEVAQLRQRIISVFEDAYQKAEFLVPYAEQRLISEMHESGKVAQEKYEDEGVRVTFHSTPETLKRFKSLLGRRKRRPS